MLNCCRWSTLCVRQTKRWSDSASSNDCFWFAHTCRSLIQNSPFLATSIAHAKQWAEAKSRCWVYAARKRGLKTRKALMVDIQSFAKLVTYLNRDLSSIIIPTENSLTLGHNPDHRRKQLFYGKKYPEHFNHSKCKVEAGIQYKPKYYLCQFFVHYR